MKIKVLLAALILVILCGFSYSSSERMNTLIKVYDFKVSTTSPVAILQNAYAIGYEKRFNELWTAQFSLPADDPKNVECSAFRYVEIFDNGDRVELFRIVPSKFQKSADGKTITYQCEHVLATLLDDIMFQYHQMIGYNPSENIDYILSKQTTSTWTRGTVDFTSIFDYGWSNENLLSALFSLPKAYTGAYQWTWDTTVYPWVLNLIEPPSISTARIMYRKNLVGITKDEDPSYIITRVYPLGYGEGINQLTIKDVNGGVPYLDADTIGTYGVKAITFIDKSTESAATLKATSAAWLETVKNPRVTYAVDGADIYAISGNSLDKFREPGILVDVLDEDIGNFTARIVSVNKSDLTGNPGDIKIEISNKALDIADTTTSIQSKQHINDVYAQGTTCIDSDDYQDNCDNTHPATIKFYIPNECVAINKCMLTFETDNFRAYETGSASGGGSTASSSSKALVFAFGVASETSTPLTGDHYHWVNSPQLDIPAHSHDVIIPTHTHDIDYGIYEFDYLPTAVIIKVDGTTIPVTALSGSDIDIIPYLSQSSGKITRGAFHTVEIYPGTTANNPAGLARVAATVTKQIFVQSRGGGNY